MYLALDIGGTTIKAGVGDAAGNLHAVARVKTPADSTTEEFLAGVRDAVMQVLGQYTVDAAGIGSPGPLDTREGFVIASSNMPGVKNAPIVRTIREAVGNLSLPVGLENDANAAALGLVLFGDARGMNDLIVFTLGTGVGGGFIFNGTLFSGYNSNAAELGHIPMNMVSLYRGEIPLRLCGCGATGCLETFSSATGVSIYHHFFRHGVMLAPRSEELFSAHEIARLAHEGEAAAIRAYELAGQALGNAAAIAVQLLTVFNIAVTGGMAAAEDLLRPAMEEHLRAHTFSVYHDKLNLFFTEGDENAGLLGALAVAVNAARGGE